MSKDLSMYVCDANISVHKNVRFHPNLSSGEKLFFAEINALSQKNENKGLIMDHKKLAELFDVSRQTVFNWIKKLNTLDLIEVAKDYKTKNCLQIIKIKNL